MELTTERKAITDYQLNSIEVKAKKGVKGFQKREETRAISIGLRIKPSIKAFLDDYCKVNNITITSLFMAGLECYTGFNGSNHEQIIEDCKKWNEE